MLNQSVVMGRLTRDPELRKTNTGVSVCSFTVACDRDYLSKETQERECDFINCVAWRNSADFLSKYFFKGSMIVVVGRLQVRKYTDKDGNSRTATEIVADNLYFGESKNSQNNSQNNGYQSSYQSSGYQSGGYQSGGYQSGGYQSSGYQSGGYQSSGYSDSVPDSFRSSESRDGASASGGFGSYQSFGASSDSGFGVLEGDDEQGLPF